MNARHPIPPSTPGPRLASGRSGLLRCVQGLLCMLLLLASAHGQEQEDEPAPKVLLPAMPEDLKPFWDKWLVARTDGDRLTMDRLAQEEPNQAEKCLNVLLDDLCIKETPELHHEVRCLAWSLDGAANQDKDRYISRVRLVLDMEMGARMRRRHAVHEWYRAMDLEAVAREELTAAAWEAALQTYFGAHEVALEVKDFELALRCLTGCELIELERKRPYEQARYLELIVALGDLGYEDAGIVAARQALDGLLAEGIDPAKEKPPELVTKEDGEPVQVGRDLEAFAEGSADIVVALEPQAPKKGIPDMVLPTIHPAEQYQLWPKAWIGGNGPVPFEPHRTALLDPWGTTWQLSRSGISQFAIDSDGDGTPDVEFSPSTTPSRVDVPGPEGSSPYPLMVSVLSDREPMFGIEANYAPNLEGSRLRFWLAGWNEGKVLGETWKLYDLNLDGKFGPGVENWDDFITEYVQGESVHYWEPDGVLIGKAKRAIPLSTVMPVGDDFYRCTPDASGKQVTVRKLALATGSLKLDIDLATAPDFLVVREIDRLAGAFFDVLPARKGAPVTLPAGTYELCLGLLRTGKRTSMDAIRIYSGKSAPFTINAGATHTLQLGAPFQLSFKTKVDGKERVVDTYSLRVFGRGGEEYAMFYDDPLQPDVSVQDEAGRNVIKADTLRRAGLEQWQNDKTERQLALWFPVEYRIEVPKARTYEFRLTQARHALLGGPFTSGWVR